MGQQPGIRHPFDARHVARRSVCLGGCVFSNDRAVEADLDQAARRCEVFGAHVSDQHVAIGGLQKVVDTGEVCYLFRCRDQRAGWNVVRICDVAAKDVRADQSTHVEVAVFANDDRVMRHVMRLV
jgi:hypothetical protein